MKFILPITPQARARARHGWTREGAHATYQAPARPLPEDELLVGHLARHRPAMPLEGAVRLDVTAFLPIPMSWSGKKILRAETGRLRPAVKPELDTLVRRLKSCLTAGGFWLDDRQVTEMAAVKRYNDGRGARWEVEIRALDEA